MEIYGKSDIGMVRQQNQDAFNFERLEDNVFYAVVCDGMGGASGGDVATKTAVEIISGIIKKNFRDNMGLNSIKTMLTTAITQANIKIFNLSKTDEKLFGMGTTVIAAIVIKNAVFLAHVGDSRAYIINSVYAFQLTRDHSMVQYLVEQGKLTAKQAKNHPEKNIITRALGVEKKVDIDYLETTMADGDILLICTDGLSNQIEGSEIKKISNEYGAGESLDRMIKLANSRGGPDNITAVALA